MGADATRILDAQTDEEVLAVLSKALTERVAPSLLGNLDAFVAALMNLPPGLRAMAATHQLDVSLTLDDLGWHFANWHHHGYALATLEGLKELGAAREAAVFGDAYAVAQRHWTKLAADDFTAWYHGSSIEQELAPLDREMTELVRAHGPAGLMGLWVRYARQHPALLIE
jgi:hypothetical protein